MVRRTIKAITNKISSLHEAAFWLALFALFSQILALVRDRLLAHHFGAGAELDIYYAAFKIPDLIFVTVASIVSISAMVPLFAKKESEGEKHLKSATDSIFTVFSFFIIISCLIAWLLMPYILPYLFTGFSVGVIEKTISLSRILLLSPLLLGFSNFFGSIVQYQRRFILYAMSPLLYNIGIITFILYKVLKIGITAAVWGVVLGALFHFLLQAIFVFYSPLRPRFSFHIKWKDIKEVAMLSIPRTLALSVVTFVGIIFASFASKLGEGSIAVFNLGFNLQSAPLSLIGVSFSLAAFPSLAISVAKKDMTDVVFKISDGLRQIIFWSLPATALIIILRAHLVRVVLGSGNFDWSDTRLTAAVLAIFVISSVFQSIQLFLSRSYYALGKTSAPLLGNIAGGALSVVLAFIFIKFYGFWASLINYIAELLNVSHLSQNILVLPLAYSIGSLATVFILYMALDTGLRTEIRKRVQGLLPHSFFSAIVMASVAYLVLNISDSIFNLDTFFGVLGHGTLAGISGIVAGAVVLYLLGNKEFKEIILKFRQLFV